MLHVEVQGHCCGVFCKTCGIIAVPTTERAQKTNIFTNQGFHGDVSVILRGSISAHIRNKNDHKEPEILH